MRRGARSPPGQGTHFIVSRKPNWYQHNNSKHSRSFFVWTKAEFHLFIGLKKGSSACHSACTMMACSMCRKSYYKDRLQVAKN